MKLPKYVHRKKAKGRTYYYFDTGVRDDNGKRMLSRLPDIRDRSFGTALQSANAQRTKRKPNQQPKNFDWLCRLYERSPEWKKLSNSTKALYSLHLRYASLNFRSDSDGSWPVDIIAAEHALSLRDKYADRPGTANVILKALGSLYKWASNPGRKYAEKSIVAEIEQFDMGEYEPWPEWLVEEGLSDPKVRLPVALLYFLGQRIGDTVRMGPQNIVRGVMHITQQKTGTSLKITVHKRLAEIIEADAPKGAMVFLMGERGKPLSAPGLRARLQKWAKAHGEAVVPHGLRKNAVNSLLAAECSVAEVSAITGQSLQMIEHYAKRRDTEKLGRSAILKFEAKDKRGTGGERENRS